MTEERRHLAAFEMPPLEDMTNEEIDDLAGVIAETIADALERSGEDVVRAPRGRTLSAD